MFYFLYIKLFFFRPYAFCGCMSLINITIPSSVTKIGESAFDLCLQLKKVEIQSNLTTIENSTFKRCFSLEKSQYSFNCSNN